MKPGIPGARRSPDPGDDRRGSSRSPFLSAWRREGALLAVLWIALLVVCVYVVTRPAPPPPPGPTVTWSGRLWSVRESYEPSGPLANYFSPSPRTVFVDESGKLHLWITFWDDTWWSSEIHRTGPFGYGTYLWRVDSPLNTLDAMAVLGLFTYSPDPEHHHREIDIEFAAWGVPGSVGRMQYVVQPYDEAGNMDSMQLGAVSGPTSHAFTWTRERIDFVSWVGHGPEPAAGDPAVIHRWSVTDPGKIPLPGNEKVHVNFYLAKGGKQPPAIGHAIEIVLSSFDFIPSGKQADGAGASAGNRRSRR